MASAAGRARSTASAGVRSSASPSVPLGGPQPAELDDVDQQQHDQHDDRERRGGAEVLALERLAVDELHHGDRAVVRAALGEDVELVEGQQRAR